jgi:uncharacterized protein YraI
MDMIHKIIKDEAVQTQSFLCTSSLQRVENSPCRNDGTPPRQKPTRIPRNSRSNDLVEGAIPYWDRWVVDEVNREKILLTATMLATEVWPTATPTVQAVAPIAATINTNKLNVRCGPGPEYDQVVELSNGQQISLIGRNADGTWVQISAQDQRWGNQRYLRVNGDVMTLPITLTEMCDWSPAGQPTGAKARAKTTLRLRGDPSVNYRHPENPDTLKPGAVVAMIGKSAEGSQYHVNVGNRNAWAVAEGSTLMGNTNAIIPFTSQ